MVGVERKIDTVPLERRFNGQVEAIGYDRHINGAGLTLPNEFREGRVYVSLAHGTEDVVSRRTDQLDLRAHAIARIHATGLPFLLQLKPLRLSERLKNVICYVAGNNGSVEIDKHTHVTKRTRHWHIS